MGGKIAADGLGWTYDIVSGLLLGAINRLGMFANDVPNTWPFSNDRTRPAEGIFA